MLWENQGNRNRGVNLKECWARREKERNLFLFDSLVGLCSLLVSTFTAHFDDSVSQAGSSPPSSLCSP